MKKMIFRTVILGLSLIASTVGFAEGLQTEKAQIRLFGDYRSASTYINQHDDGTFSLELNASYRGFSGKIERDLYSFDIDNSKLEVQGKDLFFVEDSGNKIKIASTKWWYSPKWQIDRSRVKLTSNVNIISSNTIEANPELIILPENLQK